MIMETRHNPTRPPGAPLKKHDADGGVMVVHGTRVHNGTL